MEASQKEQTGLLRVKRALLTMILTEAELNVHWQHTDFRSDMQWIFRWRQQNSKKLKFCLFPEYVFPSSRNI